MLSYGSANLGSWKDIMDMTPDTRQWYVERLEKQWELEEEKRNQS